MVASSKEGKKVADLPAKSRNANAKMPPKSANNSNSNNKNSNAKSERLAVYLNANKVTITFPG